MEDFLTLLLTQLRDGTIIKPAYYADLDCDSALDARDDDASFFAAWTNLFDEVESRWQKSGIDENTKSRIEEIRRESFLAVSHATNQHEIACYVSDDLELIARGHILDLADPMLDRLWKSYGRGEFPGQQL